MGIFGFGAFSSLNSINAMRRMSNNRRRRYLGGAYIPRHHLPQGTPQEVNPIPRLYLQGEPQAPQGTPQGEPQAPQGTPQGESQAPQGTPQGESQAPQGTQENNQGIPDKQEGEKQIQEPAFEEGELFKIFMILFVLPMLLLALIIYIS